MLCTSIKIQSRRDVRITAITKREKNPEGMILNLIWVCFKCFGKTRVTCSVLRFYVSTQHVTRYNLHCSKVNETHPNKIGYAFCEEDMCSALSLLRSRAGRLNSSHPPVDKSTGSKLKDGKPPSVLRTPPRFFEKTLFLLVFSS